MTVRDVERCGSSDPNPSLVGRGSGPPWRLPPNPVTFLPETTPAAHRSSLTVYRVPLTGDPMPIPFILVMFVLPAAIIATAVILARVTKQRDR